MFDIKWLIVFGIVLLSIGSVLSLYTETETIFGETVQEERPYQDLGLVLVFGGIISIVAGGIQMSKTSEGQTGSS